MGTYDKDDITVTVIDIIIDITDIVLFIGINTKPVGII